MKRANIGMGNIHNLLSQSLSLKHANMRHKFTFANTLKLLETQCFLPINYERQCHYFLQGKDAFAKRAYSNRIEWEILNSKDFRSHFNFREPIIIDLQLPKPPVKRVDKSE